MDPFSEDAAQIIDPSLEDPAMYGATYDRVPDPGTVKTDVADPAAALETDDPLDLFGDADGDGDDDEDEDVEEKTKDAGSEREDEAMDGLSSPERRRRKRMEYAEDSDAEDHIEQPQTEANVAIPKLPLPQSSDGKYWMLHLPNYVKIDPKPFHPDTYMGPEGQDEDDHNIKSESVQLEVNNTIRWKWIKGDDGEMHKVSNSRIIRWSDNSLSLQLGKEIYDIVDTPDAPTNGSEQKSYSYLVAQHPRAQILQATTLTTGTLTLRPTGMESDAHRALVRAVGQKHTKVARLLMAPDPTRDPEAEAKELLKKESRGVARRRVRERNAEGGGGGRAPRKKRARREEIWSDDEEEAEESLVDGDDYGGPGRRGPKGKVPLREGKRAGSYEEDDFVVKDTDDEEEADAGSPKKKKKAGAKRSRADREADEADEKDAIEEADDAWEADRRKTKKQRKAAGTGEKDKGGKANGKKEEAENMDIDVGMSVLKAEEPESEEEEEEDQGVRAVGGGRAKRTRLIMEDEEE